ncbi:MAG: hypothetical protein RL398_3103 [Planctomycetota bacterium]
MFSWLQREDRRQANSLTLIASENHCSSAVREACGSRITDKYAEGYPNRRYYGGCEAADGIEELARSRAMQLFAAEDANVQPHSGTTANLAALTALAGPGGRIVGMALKAGGHLSHGHDRSHSGMLFSAKQYGVDGSGRIDLDEVRRVCKEHQPKVLIAGGSSYCRNIDYAAFAEIAREVGAYLLADIAHPAGLVAAGVVPSPVGIADVVTMTTHKTLRGPRGGMILTKGDLGKSIRSAVFPGAQGGPLVQQIAGKAVAFGEALRPAFKSYQERVKANAQFLAACLVEKGLDIVTGGTDNHIVLVDLRKADVTGAEAEERSLAAGLAVNKNAIPDDPRPPMVTSGLRLGTPAVTTRGFGKDEIRTVADVIVGLVRGVRRSRSARPSSAFATRSRCPSRVKRPQNGGRRRETYRPDQLRDGAAVPMHYSVRPGTVRPSPSMRAKFLLPLFATLAGSAATLSAQADAKAPSADRTVRWQRTLADALAEQARTGLPLLVAVNTQGEVFNDRFAGTTYRDAEFVASTRGYICVIASPDRHNDRDYDAAGNRIECPKFPGCTCAEHIAIEPLLYERWFQGNRTAPRHLGIGTDGKVMFDRFLDNSMQTAIKAIADGRGQPREEALPTTVTELLARRGADARRALEERYRTGDTAHRIEILREAAKADTEPFDLLRIGLRDGNDEAFAAAARALAAVATKDAAIDLEDALARTEDPEVRGALIAKVAELGRSEPSLARLASHFDGDPDARLPMPWRNAWRNAAFDGADRGAIEAELDRCEAKLRAAPDDDETRLSLAVAQAALGVWLAENGGKGVELWLSDAERNAGKIRGEALAWEAAATVAVAAWHRGDSATSGAALTRAVAASASDRTPDAWLAKKTLALVARVAAQTAFGKIEATPTASLRPELLRAQTVLDMLAAREVADEATELLLGQLYELAGRRADARRVFRRVVGKSPASATAHERWRTRLLVDLGTDAMLAAYDRVVEQAADQPTAEWFAGYAALVAGEQHTNDRRTEAAIAAYGTAIDRLLRSASGNQDYGDSAHHFAVLALAGRAELRMAEGDGEGAVADLLKAAELRAESLDADDGLRRKPRGIASRVARTLEAAGNAELAARLKPILP